MYTPSPPHTDPDKDDALGSAGSAHAADAHSQPNEGGIGAYESVEATEGQPPRLVIRGESSDNNPFEGERWDLQKRSRSVHAVAYPLPRADGNPSSAITDYLNISFPFPAGHEGIHPFMSQLRTHLGECLGGLEDRRRGLHGYRESFAFDYGKALFAFGGQSGTGYLSLPGEACALVPDWQKVVTMIREFGARITRWDGAVDDYSGSHSVDDAVKWYLAGKFSAGGNKPSCSQAGNWIEPDGKGRTFYVGSRKNGKMMRIYEKGKQLGAANNPWVRWELELHNKDRVIPFEVLLEPGKYVAGSYACMAWVHDDASRIRTTQKTGGISYKHLCHYASVAYGRLLDVMMNAEGSSDAVIHLLRRQGTPARLDLPGLDVSKLGIPESGE